MGMRVYCFDGDRWSKQAQRDEVKLHNLGVSTFRVREPASSSRYGYRMCCAVSLDVP